MRRRLPLAITIIAAIALYCMPTGSGASFLAATDAETGATRKASPPDDAQKLRPGDLYDSARVYMKADNPEAALLRLDKAISIEPGMAKAHYLMGRALMKLGRMEEAGEALEKAMELSGADVKLKGGALYTRGVMRHETGMHREALKDLTKAIELLPGYAIIYAMRGRVYMALDEPIKALLDLEEAVRLEPGYEETLKESIKKLRKETKH